MVLNTESYDELNKAFKTLLQKRVPKSLTTVKENTLRIVEAYTGYIFELEQRKQSVSDFNFEIQINNRFELIRNKLKGVFELIRCPLEIPNTYLPINISYFSTFQFSDIKMPDDNSAALNAITGMLQAFSLSQTSNNQLQAERFQLDIIQLVNQLIPTPFDGQTKDQQHFISQCKVLISRGSNADLKKTIFQSIKSKLKGPALACIPATATTVEEIIAAIESNLKLDSIENVQEKLNQLSLKNTSKDKFKERLVSLLEELERGYLAMGGNAQIVKTNIMEKVTLILKKQTTDVGLFALLKTEQANAKCPSQLIDYFFTELSSHPNSSQIMSFRSNNNRSNNNRFNNNRSPRNFHNRNRPNNNNFNRNQNNNFRGNRGRGRGNRNQNFNNNHNNNNNFNNNNSNNRGNQNNQNSNYNRNSQNQNSHSRNPNNNNTRNVNVIGSENFQPILSHGDMERQ